MVRSSVPPAPRDDACVIREAGHDYCIDPVAPVLDVLARRWTLLLIGVLGNRHGGRFNELKRAVPGITARAVAERLHEMQKQGWVRRRVHARTSPPAVFYRLTPAGRGLRRALIPLIRWAEHSLP